MKWHKRWFIRIPMYIIGAVILFVAGFALFINFRGIPYYSVKTVSMKVDYTPTRFERGKKLVHLLCADCHLDQQTGRLTGKEIIDMPKQFGRAWSRNITQDPTYGIGAWSDGDIAYLLRTGIKKNGQYVPPWMVKLPGASDEDVYSIITFLRSDDSLVKAMPVHDRDGEPAWLTKFLCFVAFKPFDYPDHAIAAPDTNDKVAYGRYLANDVVHCYSCHSADFKTNDELHPEHFAGFFGGGNAMPDADGNIIYTANITMDPTNGIGKWTESQFIRAVREDFDPNNKVLQYPMSPYPDLTTDDASAIYAYLKTIPALPHAVDRSNSVMLASNAGAGATIYHKYSCNSCHGESGAGVCDLRQGFVKYPSDSALTAWIKNPAKSVPDSKMPAWEGVIQESEFTTLCAYVRELGRRSSNIAMTK